MKKSFLIALNVPLGQLNVMIQSKIVDISQSLEGKVGPHYDSFYFIVLL